MVKRLRIKASHAVPKINTPYGLVTHEWTAVPDNAYVYKEMEEECKPEPIEEAKEEETVEEVVEEAEPKEEPVEVVEEEEPKEEALPPKKPKKKRKKSWRK